MTDAHGNQLPYLDSIEFRVIEDSETAAGALESGDIDIFATSSAERDRRLPRERRVRHAATRTSSARRTTSSSTCPRPTTSPTSGCAARCSMAIDRQELIDAIGGGILDAGQRPVLARPAGLPRGQRAADGAGPRGRRGADRGVRGRDRQAGRRSSSATRRPGSTTRSPSCSSAGGARSASTPPTASSRRTSSSPWRCSATRRSRPSIWRNHAGVGVDQQYFWWHSAGSHPDGELSLNFGRLNDPGDRRPRSTPPASSATRPSSTAAAEDGQPAFAEGCYLIPLSWTLWSRDRRAERSRASARSSCRTARTARDGAGFRGPVLDPDRLHRRRMT